MIAILPILGEATTAVEPGDCGFDDPAFGFNDEAFDMVAPLDDFDQQTLQGRGGTKLEDWPRVGAVGEQLAQERELPEQGGHHQNAAVTVLNVSGSHYGVQYQTQRIDQEMALLALDQLAGIEAIRIDAWPPFSAFFTLWLSMMQAVGLASRSACSRHFT